MRERSRETGKETERNTFRRREKEFQINTFSTE